jgi:hypothetical protein
MEEYERPVKEQVRRKRNSGVFIIVCAKTGTVNGINGGNRRIER